MKEIKNIRIPNTRLSEVKIRSFTKTKLVRSFPL